MDWQDALSLIVFFLLVAFPKKRKAIKKETPHPPQTDIEVVRKKIEALKRQRSGTETSKTQTKERPQFSAYKHLPEPQATIPEVILPKISQEFSKDYVKSIDLAHKKSRLRSWVLGQVILGTPAYQRYGNFIHR